MKFLTPFLMASGASAQFGQNGFRFPSYGYGFGYSPVQNNGYGLAQSRWNAYMPRQQAPTLASKLKNWLSTYDSGEDDEAVSSMVAKGAKFFVNGADSGLDFSDVEVLRSLPRHTHSEVHTNEQGNEVSATMLATYEDGRPENVEFIRVTFNQWGKIEEIFNVSPTSPECPGMLPTAPDDDEAPAAKKAKKGGR